MLVCVYTLFMNKHMLAMKAKNNKKIKILLINNDLDVAKLARKIKKNRSWVSQVLYGHIKGEPTRRAIAEALGVPYEELWGEDK